MKKVRSVLARPGVIVGHGAGSAAWLALAAVIALSACEAPTAPHSPDGQVMPAESAAAAAAADIGAWKASELEGTFRPLIVSLAFADPNRMQLLMDAAHEGGTAGFYLRELGGPVHLAVNEAMGFEPASTIKALVHFHAMRQVQDGATIGGNVLTLGSQVANAWATQGTSSCPLPATAFSATLQVGLTAMMVPSDNPWTQALRDLFGDPSIDGTRQAFNMANTVLQHRIGCGSDALANPNQLTLVDAGRMYESVATGFLTNPTRDAAWSIMLTDAGLFNTMIDEEAAGLGLTADAINTFKAQRRSALKAGSYTLSSLEYRSVAGWAQLGYRNASCTAAPREYVYGAFIHAADAVPGLGIRALGVETFREQVREGLESWAACEADLIVSTPQVIGMAPPPLHVNEAVPFTLRHTVRNAGPALAVDAVLTTTVNTPTGCTVVPAIDTRPVPALGAATVQVDIPMTVTCPSPAMHSLQFVVEIEAANDAIVDPDLGNNSSAAFAIREFIAYADLATTGWASAELDGAGLADFLIGEMLTFGTVQSFHNFGDTELGLYHDPADVRVSRSLAVPAGVLGQVRIGAGEALAQVVIERDGQPDEVFNNVAAGSVIAASGAATIVVNFRLDNLAVNETRQVAGEFGVQCAAPGEHILLFGNSIDAVIPQLLDHVPGNNTLEVERVIDCAVAVQINIRPGNPHNFVNPGSRQSDPVAILTTHAGEYGLPLAFDASAVDAASARFGTMTVLGSNGGSAATQHFIRDSFEMDDKTKDGDLDMVLHFGIVGTGSTSQTTELCVTGRFAGAGGAWYTFLGCDAVTVNGPGGP
jgi:hypothetical protein